MHRVSMKKLVLCVLILIILICSGCYLPIIYTKSPTGSIDPSFITVGVTTKEDVILKCGNPDSAWDEKIMISYRWETFAGTWIVVVPYGGNAGAVDRTSYLEIYFDENDIVKSYNLDSNTKLRPWLTK
jgi:hypothetical protein